MKIFVLIWVILFGVARADESAKIATEGVDLEQSKTVVLPFKNLKKSLLNWDSVNPKDFLSFKKWKDNRDEKDLFPEWEIITRERLNKELAGHFYQCVGTCRVERGVGFHNATFRSNIYEGDEIVTLENSYAWFFLNDGTMVRLSPHSSITITEINIGEKENFIFARINYGDIFWLSRRESELVENNFLETDLLFRPANLYEANPKRDIKKFDSNDILAFLELPETNLNQYKELNSLIIKNNELVKSKKTYVFLLASTISIMGYAPNLEIVSMIAGKTYVKARTNQEMGYKSEESNELEYQLRGFDNKDINKLELGIWYEVDEKGKTISEDSNPAWRLTGEFITKRIPSILMAREHLMEQYSPIMYLEKYDRLVLARDFGYRLWGSLTPNGEKKDDLYLRLEFLKEYFRRVETTNLVFTEKFRKRIEERGEKLSSTEYGNYFFEDAIKKYFDYVDYTEDNNVDIELNSINNILWKKMHGIR